MLLTNKNKNLYFYEVELFFNHKIYKNVFADKNNKTLFETINSTRYKKFNSEIINNYPKFLDWPLGQFILKLKNEGNNF